MAAGRPPRTVLLLLAGLALILVIPGLISLYVDVLWFKELGYFTVFSKELTAKVLLFAVVGLVTFVFLYGNLRFAQRHISPHPVRLRAAPNQEPVELTGTVRRLGLAFAFVFALTSGLTAMSQWLPVLQYLNASPFGSADPVLARDISFYVFSLPVYEWVFALATSLCIIGLFSLIAVYWVRGDVVLFPRRIVVEPSAGSHLAALVALLLLLVSLRTFLVRIPNVLLSTSQLPGTLLQGASYTDIHVRLPALQVLGVVALLGAIFVVVGAVRRRTVFHSALAAAAYGAVAIVGGGLLPALVQKFVVAPTEFTKEQPQIVNHLSATRKAWNLDRVLVRELSGEAGLTLEDLRQNTSTIENVRLWDRDPLLRTFGQLQEIRTYYDFISVDDDRYWINGRYRQVLLSPRELNSSLLPNPNFINSHLVFTHGLGLTLGPVNEVTGEGLPVLFVKDLPPVSSVTINVTRPQIYFGEMTTSFAIVGTEQAEHDYPMGDGAATTTYSGKAGITLGNRLRRALLAAKFQAINILFSEDAKPESKLLFRREINERARLVLPFLIFDHDPYLVITDDGLLKWVMDAYTASSRYPYSRRLGSNRPNYMRNSVKVVIDAYDGNVDAYISDPDDPIVRTFDRIFDGILLPMDSMPADIRSHVRYPEDIFLAQTFMYSVYHMTDPRTFYNKEDEWAIAALDESPGTARSPFLRHIVMRLPEEKEAEFIFMTPFTPRGKDNLAAWMVARNDGPHYGELVVYRFPKQSLIFGPRQVVNRINQDTDIAREITLWDQRGSEVRRGQLLVIPIEESLVYVQPIYLQAEGGRIPELKRVVVAYQNTVVMEETFERGLARIFGGAVGTSAPPREIGEPAAGAPAPPTTGAALDARTLDLIREMQQHYDRAIAAQRAGNWAEYGTEMQRVGEIIRELGNRLPPR